MNEKIISADKEFIDQINNEFAPPYNPPKVSKPTIKPIIHSIPEPSLSRDTNALQTSDELNNGYEIEDQTGLLNQFSPAPLEPAALAEYQEDESPLPLKKLSFAEKRQRDIEQGRQGSTATLSDRAQSEKYKPSHWKRKAAILGGVISLGGGVLVAHSDKPLSQNTISGNRSANVPAQTVTAIDGTTTANAVTETTTTTNTANVPTSKQLLEASKKDTAAENNIGLLSKSRVEKIYKQLGRKTISTSKAAPVISGGAAPVTTSSIPTPTIASTTTAPSSTEKKPASQRSHKVEKNIRSGGAPAKVVPPKQTGGASLTTTTSQNNNGGTSVGK